ncbi:MAG: BlaI/MecI/CopY family transcriptional regulator [Lawsonibacter sp.]|nr:BlaI/MecI/CopY family transcriptional regulator [Lawsonibacter sp.]MCI8990611.1 BlaI/MecI/CopY family transcriptional regulator [Lawsonibacter sp.]
MTKLSDREWTVLGVLWDLDGAALGEVTQALKSSTGWSRNTVLTYLTRMEAKGLVFIEKEGYPRLYRAALSREDCQAQARDSFLRNVYRGAAGDLVTAFLKERPISSKERDQLRRLLDEMEV